MDLVQHSRRDEVVDDGARWVSRNAPQCCSHSRAKPFRDEICARVGRGHLQLIRAWSNVDGSWSLFVSSCMTSAEAVSVQNLTNSFVVPNVQHVAGKQLTFARLRQTRHTRRCTLEMLKVFWLWKIANAQCLGECPRKFVPRSLVLQHCIGRLTLQNLPICIDVSKSAHDWLRCRHWSCIRACHQYNSTNTPPFRLGDP